MSVEKTGNPLLDRILGGVDKVLMGVLARVAALDQAAVYVVSGDYTMTAENVVEYTGPGAHKITLPPANSIPGRRSRQRRILNNGKLPVDLVAVGTDTVNGQSKIALEVGCLALLESNGLDSWTVNDAIPMTSDLSGTSPVFRIGRAITSTAGFVNNLLIGWNIANGSAQNNTIVGSLAAGAPGSNCTGVGVSMTMSGAASTQVGKESSIGTSSGQAVAVGFGAAVANSATAGIAIGGSPVVSHARAIVIGENGTSDGAARLQVWCNALQVLKAISTPGSGETGLFLLADVGAGAVVKQVTLAASVGGQRALQVAG